MKTFIALFLVSACVDAASTNSAKKPEATPAEQKALNKHQTKNDVPNVLDKKEEDCDTKAKKPVEIIPEEVSLSGTAGCTLDEAKP